VSGGPVNAGSYFVIQFTVPSQTGTYDVQTVPGSGCTTNPGVRGSDTGILTVANNGPAISLTKASSPPTYTAAGQTITYTYKITNTGAVTLNGPFMISDDHINGGTAFTCGAPNAQLATGASLSCTSTYITTPADVANGSVTNLATATVIYNNTQVNSNQAVATVREAAITLTKSANPTTYSAVGQTITYTYVITNSGQAGLPATQFTISDDHINGGAAFNCGAAGTTLTPGGTVTCTATYTITQADLNNGSVTNIAQAFGAGLTSNKATAKVTGTQSPAISLTKVANPTTYSAVGQTITYTYTIKNTGNVTLTGPFTVSDNKVATVSCAAGPLAPGASLTCSGIYAITQADLNAGSVTNTATASTTYNNTPVNSNQAQATVTAVPAPAISLTKVANPTTYSSVGQTITYTYTIKNTGNVQLPGPFTVSDNKVTTVTCAAGPLAPGASLTCSGTYAITQADLNNGSVTNTATASTTYNNNPVNSNPAQATVTAVPAPAISLTKVASPTTYNTVGQTITYTYTIKNTGNVQLPGPFTVSDNKVPTVTCAAGPLAPGASLTCSGTYAITQTDLNNGSVTNTATASTTYNNAPVNSNQATATVTAILGSISGTVYTDTNQDLMLDNNEQGIGGVTVTLTDCSGNPIASVATAGNGTYLFGSLGPGCYKVVSPATANVENLETTSPLAVNLAVGQNSTNNNFGYIVPPPGITITKTASTTNTSPLQPVTYTYTVTNTGGTTLTNVNVTDDNGTPGFTGDDFLVGTVASLAPGASQQLIAKVIPAINQCVSVNGNASTPAGILVAQVLPTGDVKVTFRQTTNLVDNTYGTNASAGWTQGHKFSDLTGSDEAEFLLYDGKGNEVLDFDFDYISQSSSYPSGYGTLGVTGGDGKLNFGSAAWVLGVLSPATLSDGTVVRSTTTITTDLNQSSAFYGYTTNSPATTDPNFATWDVVDGYTIYISAAAFGSNGFGAVLIQHFHDSPSEISGTIKFFPYACSPYTVTNTATVTAVSGSTNLTASATASVTETCSTTTPPCVPLSSGSGSPPPALKLPFPSGANGTVGTPYSVTFKATGGTGPYTYAVTAGTLPPGLTLNAFTGVVSGTPTTVVSGPAAQITMTVTDSESPAKTASATGNINIAAPPALKLPFPPGTNGTVGTPYSVTFAATGGLTPYTYAVTAGTLPAGLSLNASTGVVSGTPTTPVGGPAAQITVTVTDSESPAKTASATGNINIAAPPPLHLPFPPGTNGTVGTPYSVTFAATGGITPYTYAVTAGTLPAGLSLNASTGVVSGTPTTPVSGPAAQITVTVTDSESPAKTASATGNINIGP
jgi:uncharacterized repeat protein (TIGR01451 family)